MSKDYTKLIDVYSDWLNYGPFYYLNEYNVPWKDLNIYGILDKMYLSTRGEKPVSPMLKMFITIDDDDVHTVTFDETEQDYVANMLYQMFGQKWTKIYEALEAEYDPISNYDMIETGSDTTARTGTDQHSKTGTEAHSISHTKREYIETDDDGEVGTLTTKSSVGVTTSTNTDLTASTASDITTTKGTDEHLLSGFNSSSYVDGTQDTHGADNVSGTATDNYTTTSGTAANNYSTTSGSADDNTEILIDEQIHVLSGNDTDSVSHNITDLETRNMTDTNTHTLTRSGNIGVTTSQQMQQSSIELWQYKYFEEVFNDIDRYLTLPIYI